MDEADGQNRSWRTNSNYRPSILGMYAARKRNKQKNRDGDVVTTQQAGVIHYKNDSEFQQWHQAQTCVERYCELHKVSTPCSDDHQFKNEEMETVGELSEVCGRTVLNCLFVPSSHRPTAHFLDRDSQGVRQTINQTTQLYSSHW